MFKAAIDTNRIVVTNPDKEIITSGSVNVNFIQFSFSEDWADLQKTVLFQTKKAQIPIILEGTELVYTMPVPWEVCLYANESINVGAYGTRMDDSETLEDEEIVLPTVWGTIPDKVRQGVIVTDPTPSSPTYNAYQLLLKTIADIIANGGGGGGVPGISPTISIEETDDGVILTIVDVNGGRSVTITNGIDGQDGTDGKDGFSPTISVVDIEGGKRLTIVDVNGEHVFDILNGIDGSGGSDPDFSTEIGDGLSKDGNVLSITTPVRGIFTQTEYDALPEGFRNKGLYLVGEKLPDEYEWKSPNMTSNTTPPPLVASSSSYYTPNNNLPYCAFDTININDPAADCWSSALHDNNAWLALDFGREKTFQGIRFKTRGYPAAVQFPKTIYVDISDDGLTWETIRMETDIPKQNTSDVWAVTMLFDEPFTTRHIRFSHLTDGGWYDNVNYAISIGEIEFYEVSSKSKLTVVCDEKTFCLLGESTGESSGSPQEIYSTKEIRIGTWIDGKPLYRKVFQVTCPNSGGYAIVLPASEIPNIKIRRLDGYLHARNGIVGGSINFAYSRTYIATWNYNGSIYMETNNDDYAQSPAELIIEYTKTPD